MLDTPELRSKIQSQETERFIVRVMVALIILYDHVHPTGAFAKGKKRNPNNNDNLDRYRVYLSHVLCS